MMLTCPACDARYAINADRLEGRTVKTRCKRCGERFRVSPAVESGEVYPPGPGAGSDPAQKTALVRRVEDRRAGAADLFAGLASAGAEESVATSAPPNTLFTGQRNESSVLFSLATLAKTAPAPAATVTETSSLIDLRALSAAMAKGEARPSGADDIVNLGGGGAFAFASPLGAPVVPVQSQETELPRNRKMPIMIGATALAVVAIVGVATFASARAISNAAGVSSQGPASAMTTVAPTVANAPTSAGVLAEPSAPTALLAPAASSAASAPSSPARSPTRTTDARQIASPVSSLATGGTTSASAKCCPGESESDTVCHMRLSVGAPCGAEPSTSTSTKSAPPFDRPSAARGLAISVANCKRADGPTGAGHVKVTFQPSGLVSAVDVEAPFAGTAAGACIAQRYRGVSVPAFSGGALTVGKGFALE